MTNHAPLKICLAAQEFPPYTNWGGIGIQFDNLARSVSAMGHQVVVVSRTAPGAPAFERQDSGVEVWRVGQSLSRKRFLGRTLDRILHARVVARKVAALDRECRFDVIEATESSFDAEVLIRQPEFRDRIVIACHGTNAAGERTTGLLAPLHQLDFQWSTQRECRMLHLARSVVVASEATRKVVVEHGVPGGVTVKVPLGIDVARFSPRPQLSGPPAPLTVGFVGRLERRKGLDFVWRVMEELGRESQIRFTFKGAIHPATRPQTLMMLERFSAVADYHPSGSPEDMPDFYRSIDVLLLPSRFENFGLTYAEAMASGAVVFAGQGGGGPELISDGVNGFLVDPDGSTTNVVSRLRLMAADRSIYNAISLAARNDIVAGYSIEQFGAAKVASYRVVHQEAEARRARAGVRTP